MLDTTKDIYYLVLSISVGMLTLFLLWLLFYIIQIVKNVHETLDGILVKVHAIIDSIQSIKSTFSQSIDTINSVKNTVGGIMEMMGGHVDDSDSVRKGRKSSKK